MMRHLPYLLPFGLLALLFTGCPLATHSFSPPYIWPPLDAPSTGGTLVVEYCDSGLLVQVDPNNVVPLGQLWWAGVYYGWDRPLSWLQTTTQECGGPKRPAVQFLYSPGGWRNDRTGVLCRPDPLDPNRGTLACFDNSEYTQVTVAGHDERWFTEHSTSGVAVWPHTVPVVRSNVPNWRMWEYAAAHEFGHGMGLNDIGMTTCDTETSTVLSGPTVMGNIDPISADPGVPCLLYATNWDVKETECQTYYRTTYSCGLAVDGPAAAALAATPAPVTAMCSGSSDSDGDSLPDSCDPFPTSPDGDGDAYGDFAELRLGTDMRDNCPNDPGHDAWPPDFNKDRRVGLADILMTIPFYLTRSGKDSSYLVRFDLNLDGRMGLADVLMFIPVYLAGCT